MGKKYRWLARREADTLAEAGAPVEWRYNIDIYDSDNYCALDVPKLVLYYKLNERN